MSEHSGHSGHTGDDVQREVSELEGKSTTASRLFDLRLIIGGLFVVYGVIVTIAGISPSQATLDKAEGVNINLWTGIAMLLLGIFFLGWVKLRPAPPVSAPVPPADETEE
jgi:xanthine/uracil/vitamin C permease (AzgA family)